MDEMNEEAFPCPCCSGKPYQECCQRYHLGKAAETALVLMRSRYSAYALKDADYIMATTHENNSQYNKNRAKWSKQILEFAAKTQFIKLEILAFQEGEIDAYVTFVAYLKQQKKDVTFTERSRFLKQQGRWFYLSGTTLPGAIV